MPTQTRPGVKYSSHFVAFVDVLGFRQLVKASEKSDDIRSKLNTYYNITHYIRDTWKTISEKREIKCLVVSDSVILALPSDGTTAEQKSEMLKHLCVAVGGLQFHLAVNNIWTRGAITHGLGRFDEENFVLIGPAYIAAYDLEQEMAHFPRVILDSALISELGLLSAQALIERINGPTGLDYTNWKGNILYDWLKAVHLPARLSQDVPLFIDYLNPCARKTADFGEPREVIFDNLVGNLRGPVQHYGKYRWVADYLRTKFEGSGQHDDKAFAERLARL